MTVNQAVNALRSAYQKAPMGEKEVAIHLFGIKYARELRELKLLGVSMSDIVRKAQPLGKSKGANYAAEVSKGVKLAKYVKIVRDQ